MVYSNLKKSQSSSDSDPSFGLAVDIQQQVAFEGLLNSYCIYVLQTCDNLNLPNSIKFRCLSLMKGLLQAHSFILFSDNREYYLCACLEMLIELSSLFQIPAVPTPNKENIKYELFQIYHQLNLDAPTPFDMIGDLASGKAISAQLKGKLNNLVSFSLTMPTLNQYSSCQIVRAALLMTLSHQELSYVVQGQEHVSLYSPNGDSTVIEHEIFLLKNLIASSLQTALQTAE